MVIKSTFGKMLLVPQLIPHMILSVRALASEGCRIEFNNSSTRELSPIGNEMIIAQRSASSLYYVSCMWNKSFKAPQLKLPNVKCPAQCVVLKQIVSTVNQKHQYQVPKGNLQVKYLLMIISLTSPKLKLRDYPQSSDFNYDVNNLYSYISNTNGNAQTAMPTRSSRAQIPSHLTSTSTKAPHEYRNIFDPMRTYSYPDFPTLLNPLGLMEKHLSLVWFDET